MEERYMVSAVLGPFESKEAAEQAQNDVKSALQETVQRVPGSPTLYCNVIGAGSGN